MASSTDHGSLVVSSNLTSTMKTLFKESEFPHVKNLINTLPGSPEIVKNFGVGTYGPTRRPSIPLLKGGESVIWLSSVRRLVNVLPAAQRTNALTNDGISTDWVLFPLQRRPLQQRDGRGLLLAAAHVAHGRQLWTACRRRCTSELCSSRLRTADPSTHETRGQAFWS